MVSFQDVIESITPYQGVLELVIIILATFIILNIILKIIKKRLLKIVKNRKQASNVTVFIDLLKYLFAFFLIIVGISVYSGKLGDLGFVAGLLTVALGWALQKPISGVVAWLMLVTRRPFHIGDRIIIANMKGDIKHMTLTHIFLDEVGGTIDGEENSGRTVMIPNSIIFEQELINYTQRDEYILDEITTSITYESDLIKSEQLILEAVQKIMNPLHEKFLKRISKDAHIRLNFKSSGIDVTVRYYTLTQGRNKISTDIRRVIWKKIIATPTVEFAYPHTEILFHEKQQEKIKKNQNKNRDE
jgi:small-conductance mechanosensitive channel